MTTVTTIEQRDAGGTLRVNGTARMSIAPALLERFKMDGKPPRRARESLW
jgi:predicted pyridoxine 5'-phosphate oxidase superfamily flavin-nucleotide-binding protein